MSTQAPNAAALEALRVAIGATTALRATGGGVKLLRQYVDGLQQDLGPVSAEAHLRVGLLSLVNVLLVTLEVDHGVDTHKMLTDIAQRFGQR